MYIVKSIILSFFTISQELNNRAQGEVTIRDALRELDLWGAGAIFSLTAYNDTNGKELQLIKDWRDLFNQVLIPLYHFYQIVSTFLNILS